MVTHQIVALFGAALGPFAPQAFGLSVAMMFFGIVLASFSCSSSRCGWTNTSDRLAKLLKTV